MSSEDLNSTTLLNHSAGICLAWWVQPSFITPFPWGSVVVWWVAKGFWEEEGLPVCTGWRPGLLTEVRLAASALQRAAWSHHDLSASRLSFPSVERCFPLTSCFLAFSKVNKLEVCNLLEDAIAGPTVASPSAASPLSLGSTLDRQTADLEGSTVSGCLSGSSGWFQRCWSYCCQCRCYQLHCFWLCFWLWYICHNWCAASTGIRQQLHIAQIAENP